MVFQNRRQRCGPFRWRRGRRLCAAAHPHPAAEDFAPPAAMRAVVTGDAMECAAAAGLISRTSPMRGWCVDARCDLGSIWEGTSNIVALDVLRARSARARWRRWKRISPRCAPRRRRSCRISWMRPSAPSPWPAMRWARAARCWRGRPARRLYNVTAATAIAWEAARAQLPERALLAHMVLRTACCRAIRWRRKGGGDPGRAAARSGLRIEEGAALPDPRRSGGMRLPVHADGGVPAGAGSLSCQRPNSSAAGMRFCGPSGRRAQTSALCLASCRRHAFGVTPARRRAAFAASARGVGGSCRWHPALADPQTPGAKLPVCLASPDGRRAAFAGLGTSLKLVPLVLGPWFRRSRHTNPARRCRSPWR